MSGKNRDMNEKRTNEVKKSLEDFGLRYKEPGRPHDRDELDPELFLLGYICEVRYLLRDISDSINDIRDHLVRTPSEWRKDKATRKQREFLNRYDITYDSEITKGEASDLIDKKIKQMRR